MEQLTANLSGKVRRETLLGRRYLVAPITLLVPGVLNGSKGPLLYPPDEVAKSAAAWNDQPMVLYHPYKDGRPVPVNTPGVLEESGLGFIRNSRFKDKLRADGWFDVEKTARIAPDVLKSLEQGRPIELSTGLLTDNEPAQNGASHEGRPYAHVARNYRPDHLAILPDQVGACSLKDGCGVLVNRRGRRPMLKSHKARFAKFRRTCNALGLNPAKDADGNWSAEGDGFTLNYNTGQPRDSHGRWGSGGGGKHMAADTGAPMGGGGLGDSGARANDLTFQAAIASKEAGGPSQKSAEALQRNVKTVLDSGKTISKKGHELLAQAHDSIAAAHYSAMKQAPEVYREDQGGRATPSELHETAAYAHQNAAAAHRAVVNNEAVDNYSPGQPRDSRGRWGSGGGGSSSKSKSKGRSSGGGKAGGGSFSEKTGIPDDPNAGSLYHEALKNEPSPQKWTSETKDAKVIHDEDTGSLTLIPKGKHEAISLEGEVSGGTWKGGTKSTGEMKAKPKRLSQDELESTLAKEPQNTQRSHPMAGYKNSAGEYSYAWTGRPVNKKRLVGGTHEVFSSGKGGGWSILDHSTGQIPADGIASLELAMKRAKALVKQKKPTQNHEGQSGPSTTNNEGGHDMASMTQEERKAIIDGLVANDCCGWKASDRPMLESVDDAVLNRLKDTAEKTKQTELLANRAKELEAKITANALTAEQLEDIAFARRIKQERKDKAVAAITANAQNKFTKEQLNSMTLDIVENMAALLPVAKVEEKRPLVSYAGAAAPIANAQADDSQDDLLIVPTMNWDEKA